MPDNDINNAGKLFYHGAADKIYWGDKDGFGNLVFRPISRDVIHNIFTPEVMMIQHGYVHVAGPEVGPDTSLIKHGQHVYLLDTIGADISSSLAKRLITQEARHFCEFDFERAVIVDDDTFNSYPNGPAINYTGL